MNKLKMKFMQEAPRFVIVGGFSSLAFFAVVAILICFTDEWKFGIYVLALCISAICFLIYAWQRFEKICNRSISDIMAEDKEYWRTHDK